MSENKSGYFWLNDLIKNSEKILKESDSYLSLNIQELNSSIKGLIEQQFYVLAARPSVGKTTFCLNIIARALKGLKDNEIIVFFSLEMSTREILNRLLEILKIMYSDKELEELQREKRLLIVDYPNSNVFKIGNFIDDLNKTFKVRSLIIDHLQLLNLEKNQQNLPRYEKMTQITRQLKIISKEKSINILAISQLSRDFEKRNSALKLNEIDVQLSDLRDSGSIEQDADVVMFLVNKKDPKNKEKYSVVIAKNRNGGTDIINAIFLKSKFLFFFQSDIFCKKCSRWINEIRKIKLTDDNWVCSECVKNNSKNATASVNLENNGV
ncbi:DnaB-like helicase C-terminal domain-containing protein [Metamycoplasma auris]|uniref:Replicative DNA helicase n=1 Tax=Metamycoplasma auris TaxID=51363 RepID=A0A2W7FYE3_9BACT|nr:DnaB-like helicase C-terminal domain-containing protein [Metamycoplasma auris]PZV98693.1 replicative DNA helicase [Metamycoplasma auris]